MPPLEAWEKVLIDPEAISTDPHGEIPCTECHGGANVGNMSEAHDGLVADPSEDGGAICGTCHAEIQAAHESSLHATLAGYDTALYSRSIPENHPAIEEMEANHCNNCHATCGQCHVSQPTSVGGGLLEGHTFVEQPPMTRTCTGCHGSRIKDEFTGRNEGFQADVHFRQGRMNCVNCHDGDEMHGETVEADHRYAGERIPQCETCHANEVTSESNLHHTIHNELVSCQVCHSVSYKNCSGCHTQQNENGVAFYEIDPSWMDFRIGRNPNPSEERPWLYVLVRHVPVDRDSFAYYGANLLPDYEARPTWLEATPHNIQRVTPQTERCQNCHGNAAIFLTEDAVDPAERAANQAVIVDEPAHPID